MISNDKEYKRLLGKYKQYSEIVERVYKSCETLEQFKVAQQYAKLARNKLDLTDFSEGREYLKMIEIDLKYNAPFSPYQASLGRNCENSRNSL